MPYIKKDENNNIIAIFSNQQFDDKGNSLNLTWIDVLPEQHLQKQQQNQNISELLNQLNADDWKIIRHVEEKAANLTTTLTNTQFIALNKKRKDIRENISRLRAN
jgi:hypothetical protein